MNVALFSQTGSEIKRLRDSGVVFDLVYTNSTDNMRYYKNVPDALYLEHKDLMEALLSLPRIDLTITLHGYLRIIPPNVCERLNIYNGHPGLITYYPWLKGINPQERVVKDMEWMGSVVHKVTAGVDEGKVLFESKVKNTGEDPYNVLSETSFKAWRKFFEQRS